MKVEFIIDGASVGASSGATFTRKDPVTGKIVSEAAAAGLADVEKVVVAASGHSRPGRRPDRENGARSC